MSLEEFEKESKSLIAVCKKINSCLLDKEISINKYFPNIETKNTNILQDKKYSVDVGQKTSYHHKEKTFKKIPVAPEKQYVDVQEPSLSPSFKARKINWEEIAKSAKEIGEQGELIALDIEKTYLNDIGKASLSDKVLQISKIRGDGAGYDILSYFPDGRERYIEVKTTTQSSDEPFLFTSNEKSFMNANLDKFFIYRIYINKNEQNYSLQIYSASDVIKMEQKPISFRVFPK